ncbi:hypothetical protein EZJ49_07540 [Bdellovibrio bacteriovorus]|uniref:hypothetical protein n=1 Tax=Bdellovibrio bacteriovorus TaxID=959 RepID=UPI0021D20C7B|nr:hypothetical protein [Bdellovibrio bacteriovorus]UXR66101.1 hypothetical protein EZJ49_07540 [Bdellovibrio bacteriovorus]
MCNPFVIQSVHNVLKVSSLNEKAHKDCRLVLEGFVLNAPEITTAISMLSFIEKELYESIKVNWRSQPFPYRIIMFPFYLRIRKRMIAVARTASLAKQAFVE